MIKKVFKKHIQIPEVTLRSRRLEGRVNDLVNNCRVVFLSPFAAFTPKITQASRRWDSSTCIQAKTKFIISREYYFEQYMWINNTVLMRLI